METAFIMYYDIISSNDIIKENKVTLDRSPEFCFKRLIYMYLLETGHAPNWNLIKCCLPADATYQISGLYAWLFQTRRLFYVFTICKSM